MLPVAKIFETSHSADKLIHEYYCQSEAIIQKAKVADRLLTLPETKRLKELANAIKNLDVTLDERSTMTIFMRLTDYINKSDHDFAVRLIGFQKDYLKEVFDITIK
jgi:hypothetical protein